MKIQSLLILIFCGACLCSSGITNKLENIMKVALPFITPSSDVAEGFAQLLFKSFIPLGLDSLAKIQPGQERFPIIPILPDPILLRDGNYTLNIENVLVGDLAVWNHRIEGLSGLKDRLGIKLVCDPIIGTTVSMGLFLPSIYIRGDGYGVDLKLLESKFIGTGAFRAGVLNTSIQVGFHLGFKDMEHFHISGLNAGLILEGLDLFAENLEVDGVLMTEEMFKTLSENLVPLINQIVPVIVDPLLPNITMALNTAIEDCKIINFLRFVLGLGDLSCIKIPAAAGYIKSDSNIYEIVDQIHFPGSIDFSKSFYTDLVPYLIAEAESAGIVQDFSRSIILSLIKSMQRSHFQGKFPGQGRVDIIPDFEDPIFFNGTNLPLNLILLKTNMTVSDGVITGQSGIQDDFELIIQAFPFEILANFTLTEPEETFSIMFNGTHASEVNLILPPLDSFVLFKGEGEFEMGIKNVFFRVGVHIGFQDEDNLNKLQIHDFSLDMGFDEVILFFENFFIGECQYPIPVYWQGVSEFFKKVLDLLWNNPTSKPLVINFIRNSLNNIIKDCTISQLLDMIIGSGDNSCLSHPIQPTTPTLPTSPTTTLSTTLKSTTLAPTTLSPTTPTIPPTTAPATTPPTTAPATTPPTTAPATTPPTTAPATTPPTTAPATTPPTTAPATTPPTTAPATTTPPATTTAPATTAPTTTILPGESQSTEVTSNTSIDPKTDPSPAKTTEGNTSENPTNPSTSDAGPVNLKSASLSLLIFCSNIAVLKFYNNM